MNTQAESLFKRYVSSKDHSRNDYLGLINELLQLDKNLPDWQKSVDQAYSLLLQEIEESREKPVQPISFGTSGWRGRLGKDINARSVVIVTLAIVRMYETLDRDNSLATLLGVASTDEAKKRGCVLGYDNRFAGSVLATKVASVLSEAGFVVYFAGESTTGVLSAAVLQRQAAFSINLTPSHNPFEYGGYKFNAADAGPAAAPITERITAGARALLEDQSQSGVFERHQTADILPASIDFQPIDALGDWLQLVAANLGSHGLDLQRAVGLFETRQDLLVAVDCVHGASRLHIRRLFGESHNPRLVLLRNEADVTFGGVAPEPSWANMQPMLHCMKERTEKYQLGAIIDPDGDRIRFTDGHREIGMNQFGAMAYHFLHEYKGKNGMVAKTVATSNLANALAGAFGESLFEPAVGFKNFKSVIGQALVCFEESDGLTVIGHTPEKDAYIGLLLALEMIEVTGLTLGEYLERIEREYGPFYSARDGIAVAVQGEILEERLNSLKKYQKGMRVAVGGEEQRIAEVIDIDGIKMVFADGSWLMIRPSGTEPKVRFYVESRTRSGTDDLVAAARRMLDEAGVLQGVGQGD
jgi:phosphomannomutase